MQQGNTNILDPTHILGSIRLRGVVGCDGSTRLDCVVTQLCLILVYYCLLPPLSLISHHFSFLFYLLFSLSLSLSLPRPLTVTLSLLLSLLLEIIFESRIPFLHTFSLEPILQNSWCFQNLLLLQVIIQMPNQNTDKICKRYFPL